MTRLTGITPTPTQFADSWVDELSAATVRAGGADGRISLASAKNAAKRSGPDALISDNLVGYLESAGQKSVSVNKFLGIAHGYIEREAAAVAGANQRVSLVEARMLPKDLEADFFYLRGKGLPATKTWADLAVEVRERVLSAFGAWTAPVLSRAPWQVRGVRPIDENIPHPTFPGIRGIAYVADGRLYVSVARSGSAQAGAPAVGWYDLGEAHWDG